VVHSVASEKALVYHEKIGVFSCWGWVWGGEKRVVLISKNSTQTTLFP
jgi:hypothetical protein